MRLHILAALGLSALVPAAALADFQYQETTQITGGSMLAMLKMAGMFSAQARQAGAPVISSVYVQGNRMARVNPHSIEIIDLDKETITNVDLDKHSYTEMTFDQMKQQMEKAMEQAKERQAKQQDAPAPQPTSQPSDVDVKFKVNVRNTGAAKAVSGLDTTESILTMEMEGTDTTNGQKGAFAITNDMWMTPEVPGYEELREFNRKLAMKMGEVFAGSGMAASFAAMNPGAARGMGELAGEVSKLKGIPVQQIMRMGATANGDPLPAASEAPLPATNGPQMPSAGDVAQESATSAIASKLSGLGGFGGFGKKKQKQQDPAPQQNAGGGQDANAAAATVLIESQTQMTAFSQAPIDAGKFAVPAGYKLVQPR
jgi:hypothetical protein